MKCAFALASAVALAGPSLPEQTYGPNTLHYGGWPPAEYQRDFAAITVFAADISPYCGRAPEGIVRVGCMWRRADGVPMIALLHPAYFPNETFARFVAHEGAHALGWPATHPVELIP